MRLRSGQEIANQNEFQNPHYTRSQIHNTLNHRDTTAQNPAAIKAGFITLSHSNTNKYYSCVSCTIVRFLSRSGEYPILAPKKKHWGELCYESLF
jgi:hypothetical protein